MDTKAQTREAPVNAIVN